MIPVNGQRTWQLGLLAKDMAVGRMFGNGAGEPAFNSKIAERLSKLHGLPQKIGQIIALTELLDPKPVYSVLTESEGTFPEEEARAHLEHALGRKLEECFSRISGSGIGASIGQVHRAALPDGTEVAVKFKYPGIDQAVKADLQALGWLAAPIGNLKKGFSFESYQNEVAAMLLEELDYEREAAHVLEFGTFLQGLGWARVPRVIDSLSNPQVLTTTWVEGERFGATLAWSEKQRRLTAERLLRLFLHSCFRHGCVHGDPHPGNYRFELERGEVRIGLMDFGCVKRLNHGQVQALLRLIELAARGAGEAEVQEAYLVLGFNPEFLGPMKRLLPELTAVLFEPFAAAEFDLSRWDLGPRVERLLGEFRWNFRYAGPANLLYFIRAYQGLVQYLKALRISVNWRQALEESAPEVSVLKRPAAGGPAAALQRLSQTLRIRLEEDGQMKVDMRMGSGAVEDLEELMPERFLPKLKEQGIRISELVREVVQSNFAPRVLFDIRENARRVRVWLE